MQKYRVAAIHSCFAFLISAVVVALPGCGDPIVDGVAAMNKTKLQQLYNCYKLYSNNHGYQGPVDKETLTTFLLQDQFKTNLKRMQIDRENLDALFLNDRDGKPFKVRWAVNGFGDKAVIFEEEGVNGMRWVALQEAREVDAKEYEALWTGKQKVETVLPSQEAGPEDAGP
ncbi:MAG: hypothetical protein RH917_03245 [Lacipirellulaceae bacterium]